MDCPEIVLIPGTFDRFGKVLKFFLRFLRDAGFKTEIIALPEKCVSISEYRDAVLAGLAGKKRLVLIGHSLGGILAAQAASELHDIVKALIMIAPSPPKRVEIPTSCGNLCIFGPAAYKISKEELFKPPFCAFRKFIAPAIPKIFHESAYQALTPESSSLIKEIAFSADTTEVGKIFCPSLALIGSNDSLIPPANAQKTAEFLGSDLHIIPEADHLLPAGMQREIAAKLIINWLRIKKIINAH